MQTSPDSRGRRRLRSSRLRAPAPLRADGRRPTRRERRRPSGDAATHRARGNGGSPEQTERIDVGGDRTRFAREPLRSHVYGRPDREHGGDVARDRRHAEVRDADPAGLVEHHVTGLEILAEGSSMRSRSRTSGARTPRACSSHRRIGSRTSIPRSSGIDAGRVALFPGIAVAYVCPRKRPWPSVYCER
jgi:hypothetical protein